MKRAFLVFCAMVLPACGGFYTTKGAPIHHLLEREITIRVMMFLDSDFSLPRNDELTNTINTAFYNRISAAFERRGIRVAEGGEVILEVKLYYFEKFHPFYPKRLQVHATLRHGDRITEFEREEAGGLITPPTTMGEKAASLLFLSIAHSGPS